LATVSIAPDPLTLAALMLGTSTLMAQRGIPSRRSDSIAAPSNRDFHIALSDAP
jgi:hypothetical protein